MRDVLSKRIAAVYDQALAEKINETVGGGTSSETPASCKSINDRLENFEANSSGVLEFSKLVNCERVKAHSRPATSIKPFTFTAEDQPFEAFGVDDIDVRFRGKVLLLVFTMKNNEPKMIEVLPLGYLSGPDLMNSFERRYNKQPFRYTLFL